MRLFLIFIVIFPIWGQKDKYLDVKHLSAELQKHHIAAVDELDTSFHKWIKFHKAFGPGDESCWYAWKKEPGQTYSQYLAKKPFRADDKQTTIYITTIGPFSKKQKQIIEQTRQYIGLYFQVPVKFIDAIEVSTIPSSARRKLYGGHLQLNSRYILYKVLKPKRPKDALAVIALTSIDLYPADDWNFVYGQASLTSRVGVWSVYRNGNAGGTKKEYELCLLRTLKTASHEMGHIFKIKHCIAFHCVMNGANHREESDNRPMWLCPVCLHKLNYAIKFSPTQRYRELAKFFRDIKLPVKSDFYQKSAEIVE